MTFLSVFGRVLNATFNPVDEERLAAYALNQSDDLRPDTRNLTERTTEGFEAMRERMRTDAEAYEKEAAVAAGRASECRLAVRSLEAAIAVLKGE